MEGRSHSSILPALPWLLLLQLPLRVQVKVSVCPWCRVVSACSFWVQCFDLPFRGEAVVYKGLDRKKQNSSPPSQLRSAYRLPPGRHCRSQLCSSVCSCPLVAGSLLGPSSPWSLEIGWPTVGRSALTGDYLG